VSNSNFLANPGIQNWPQSQQDWTHFVNEAQKFIADAITLATLETSVGTLETDVDTAESNITTLQADVISAARSAVSVEILPGGVLYNSDTAGVFAAGDPSTDILFTFKDNEGTEVANRTLRGTLTSATGNISVTAVSDNNLVTGYSTAYSLVDDGTASVVALVTLTLPDSSKFPASASWNSLDESTAGTTPVTGGGK